ncbi:MAG: hypothetical protein CMG75_00030 [Candidatus Marinimicrobia bacterium]|nr:hypothetical protein [Candidatus Neomarinimicrobiota bacterium]|tara:strand:- start:3629 stop:4570 length:942 start_codon:yes stop_codon:yes gene_type:complete
MNTTIKILNKIFIFLCFFTLGSSQEKGNIKFFKTDLHRSDLLKDEISNEDANKTNHFKAYYNSRGRLVKVEFYPNGDRILAQLKKNEIFPRAKPPFKYFRNWNPHLRQFGKELSPSKIGKLPYYRASYEEDSSIRTIEFFQKRNRHLWTYYFMTTEGEEESRLFIVFAKQQALTLMEPHLFHPSASEMKKGWIAEFQHNRLNRPIETLISDPLGNRYYFYRFKHRYETEGDSINPITFRYTTSEYFLADSTKMGSHQLIYDENERLLKKEFFDNQNNLLESIEYIFDNARSELVTIIRDPKGGILHREVKRRN